MSVFDKIAVPSLLDYVVRDLPLDPGFNPIRMQAARREATYDPDLGRATYQPWSSKEQDPRKTPAPYGLEVRGLLGSCLRFAEVRNYSGDWQAFVQVEVPSVDGSGPVLVQHQSTKDGHMIENLRANRYPHLTPQQVVLQLALRELWEHEWKESLAVGGVPLEDPHPELRERIQYSIDGGL